MPLTALQKEVVRLLAGNRNEASHLAGGSAINRSEASPRYSADLDLFHDTAERVAISADADAQVLTAAGFTVQWLLRHKGFARAVARRAADQLKIEWCFDSRFRFFPIQKDDAFGYCLHPADLATNKALALAGRNEVRDLLDILYLHDSYLDLGAVVWAACGKDQGFTPWSLLDMAKRHVRYREEDLASENLARPTSLKTLKEQWVAAVEEAEDLFARLPASEVGCLYLDKTGLPVSPDPGHADFPKLIRHSGTAGGALPNLA